MGNVIQFPRRPTGIVTPVKFPLAFYIGVRAKENGIAFLDNPYHPIEHATQHTAWNDGWCAEAMGGQDVSSV